MSFPRYPEYKDSGVEWLGEVPAHWVTTRLGFLATKIGSGKTPSGGSEVYRDQGVLFLRSQNVHDTGMELADAVYIAPDVDEEMSSTRVRPGDLLLNITGASLGRSCIVPDDFPGGNVNQHVCIIRPADRGLGPFLAWAMKSRGAKSNMDHAQNGAAREGLNFSHISKLQVAVPPASEQGRLCTFLHRETAKIDALVAEQERLIELLAEKRQAVISHAVTKGLNPGVPTKDSGISWLGRVPAHWEVRRAKSVSRFTTSGPRGWSERIGEEGVLFIQSGDLNDALGIEFLSSKRVAAEDDAESVRTALRDGDVVVCITGAKTGNVAVASSVPERAHINQHLCLIRPTEAVLPGFLGLLLKGIVGRTHFELSQYGLKQGLSLEDVRETPVLLPPMTEQLAIVDHLATIIAKLDELSIDAHRAVDLLQERRAALTSAAVTGQIDVRSVAPQGAA